MKAEKLAQLTGAEFYTGVPDSQLKALCNYLMDRYGIDPQHHVIAANEGNAMGLAAGYHLATGKVPVVYMQNSGEGNVINPLASLVNDRVYAIPMLLIIGGRGEPGVHDEPQHIYQGEVTVRLMEDMDVDTFIIGKDTTEQEIDEAMERFRGVFRQGRQAAFIVRKGALSYEGKPDYHNDFTLNREEVIQHIAAASGTDPIVSTTGKISRELFETRTANGEGHQHDFLTVGSMGHCSMIALGVALQKPQQRIWCIDGDGAVLMHMGAMAVIGSNHPENLIHVVINNNAHETVGGLPTVAGDMNMVAAAKACGYPYAESVDTMDELDRALQESKDREALSLIEVRCALGAREDLGRPTTTALENKEHFMEYLKEL